jgi:hypothetical protein
MLLRWVPAGGFVPSQDKRLHHQGNRIDALEFL